MKEDGLNSEIGRFK